MTDHAAFAIDAKPSEILQSIATLLKGGAKPQAVAQIAEDLARRLKEKNQ